MPPEVLGAWAAVGTVIVIGASAIAALVQLRHMRAANQIEALLSIDRNFQSPALQRALGWAQHDLARRLEDPAYREKLARIGYVDTEAHPELLLCNWFNQMGAMLKHGLVTESAFLDLFAKLIVYYWRILSPAIAIMRRARGDFQYHDFEFLAVRAQRWLQRHPQGLFPGGTARMNVEDPWLTADFREATV